VGETDPKMKSRVREGAYLILTLNNIANAIGAEFVCSKNFSSKNNLISPGDEMPIGLAPLDSADSSRISFLSNPKYLKDLLKTKALAVILSPECLNSCPENTHALVLKDPYLGFAKAAALFDRTPRIKLGVAKTAVIHPSVLIDQGACIGDFACIGKNVRIGKNVQIYPHCVIGDNVLIGDDVILYPHVVIYHDVHLGHRCIIHSTAVIGSDGFGLANDQGRWIKIPQLGGVRIGSDVEIGASTTIDRGALSHTVIEDGVKLDNQIQIGHNDFIGAHTAMAGGTMVAGSTTIGKYCVIGGQSAISGHLSIADQVKITGGSSVPSDLLESGATYSSSMKALPHKTWFRALANLNRLDKLRDRIKKLEEKIYGRSEGGRE